MRMDVDWKDKNSYDSWMKAWDKARKSGRLEDGYECAEYGVCSGITRLICADLFRSFHLHGVDDGTRPFDGVSVEGETLSHAISFNVFCVEATREDNAAAARAAEELTRAGLVIQRTPGKWELHFGRAMTKAALLEHEEARRRIRLEYQSYERSLDEDRRANN